MQSPGWLSGCWRWGHHTQSRRLCSTGRRIGTRSGNLRFSRSCKCQSRLPATKYKAQYILKPFRRWGHNIRHHVARLGPFLQRKALFVGWVAGQELCEKILKDIGPTFLTLKKACGAFPPMTRKFVEQRRSLEIPSRTKFKNPDMLVPVWRSEHYSGWVLFIYGLDKGNYVPCLVRFYNHGCATQRISSTWCSALVPSQSVITSWIYQLVE